MNKEIPFYGYATAPSDYECRDGQLAASLNLISEDGHLKPVMQPHMLGTIPTLNHVNYKALFVHETAAYKHYIFYKPTDPARLAYYSEDDNGALTGETDMFSIDCEPISISAMGGVLIICLSTGIVFAVWSTDKEAYTYLGGKPPRIDVGIGINTALLSSYSITISDTKNDWTFDTYVSKDKFNTALSEGTNVYVDDDKKSNLINRIFALLNQMIVQVQEDGCFCYPFFIRFCYRLFDGSRIMHTAPYLVVPTSTGKPLLYLYEQSGNINPFFVLPKTELSFSFPKMDEAWKDIITDVDILATPQIYGYTADNVGFDSISLPDDDDLNAFTIGGYHTIGGVSHCQEARIADLAEEGITPVRLVTGWKNSFTYIWNYPQSTAKRPMYIFMNVKGNPDNFKVTAMASEGTTGDKELGTVTEAEARAAGVQIPEHDSDTDIYKIYYFDPSMSRSDYPYLQIYRDGDLRKKRIYYTTVPGTIINSDKVLSIHLKYGDTIDTTFLEQITSESNFHLLMSVPYEELIKEATTIKIDPDKTKVANIAVDETVADHYRTGDTLIAERTFNYNSRMNTAPTALIPYAGDSIQKIGIYPYYDQKYSASTALSYEEKPQATNTITAMYVEISENNCRTLIQLPTSEVDGIYNSGLQTTYLRWFFYPNPNARTLWIETTNQGTKMRYPISLTRHDTLTGAYAFNSFEPIFDEYTEADNAGFDKLYSSVFNAKILVNSKIYTSEVTNPFCILATNINTVGTGTVMGLSSTTKALSQGQFGQFPLYAFTTDGVWALQTNSAGSYSAVTPVARDVCTNADSITQLDSSILFTTERGIMEISGSTVACISDEIDAQQPFDITALPAIDKLHTMIGHSRDTCIPTAPFLSFLDGCKMIYDYLHQRVIVYNASYTYAYVFSTKSRRWGMMYSLISYNLNAYPEALAVTHNPTSEGGTLVSFESTDDSEVQGFYVTRPLKLDAPDVLKTVREVIQRGYFKRGDVATVLYASRDLYTWHLVWSSKDHYLRGFSGTPYKYFRIAGVATLTADKSIYSLTVRYEPKQTNRLR